MYTKLKTKLKKKKNSNGYWYTKENKMDEANGYERTKRPTDRPTDRFG